LLWPPTVVVWPFPPVMVKVLVAALTEATAQAHDRAT
jgi:hypothetical protein